MKVADDGQSWWAQRRTIRGWVFAIGAAAPPPSQQFFNGPEPHEAGPGTSGWGAEHEWTPNWIG